VDPACLARELEALHPHCFGWAMACCDRRSEVAEDVLHDVYAKVLDGSARFGGESTMRTWLFGVIRKTAAARLRKERLHYILGIRHAARADRPAAATSPEDDAIQSDRRARLRRALSDLSARQREVLELVFYHDLTLEDAATIMQVSSGSAHRHYHRGKARLATLLHGDRP
jgi:RNA polymerase sigma-70 factor (ECF subfamily)